jgi:hypothetical protein
MSSTFLNMFRFAFFRGKIYWLRLQVYMLYGIQYRQKRSKFGKTVSINTGGTWMKYLPLYALSDSCNLTVVSRNYNKTYTKTDVRRSAESHIRNATFNTVLSMHLTDISLDLTRKLGQQQSM